MPKKAPKFAADLNMLKEQDMRLEHISKELGEICQPPTKWQITHERATGNSITAHCFICRKYMKKEGKANYIQTAF
jgi:hypothetical protein